MRIAACSLVTLWNHGLSTYDCLSGGGGSGRVALSVDSEVLLPEWGNVADFLSGDRSVNHKNPGSTLNRIL